MAEYLLFTIVSANTESEALDKSKQIADLLEGEDVPLDALETFDTTLWMHSNTIKECITPLRLPMNENGVNTLKLNQLKKHGNDDAIEEFREEFAIPLTTEETYVRVMDGIDRQMAIVVDATGDSIEYLTSRHDIKNLISSDIDGVWLSKWSVRFND